MANQGSPTSESTASARVLVAGAGETARFFADDLIVKEHRRELDITEAVLHAGSEPPLHIHGREDEWLYVVDGAITAFAGGDEYHLAARDLVFLPKGVLHTCQAAATYGGDMPAVPGPETGELMGPVFDAYGVTMVGPNPRHT